MSEKDEKSSSRVLVVGFDGADFDLIQPWVQAGQLPGFAKIMDEGAWGKLESVHNQRSAAAWTSFMTGKNPGKHGIFEFYDYLPDSYNISFIKGQMRQGETLWHLAGQAGKKVGVINVPMTYPAEKVNGFLIAGLDAPGVESKGFTYPPELHKEIVDKVGAYIIEPGLIGCIVGGDVDQAEAKLYEEIDQKIEVCRHLMKKYPWDLFVTVFRSTDAAHHAFWKYIDKEHPEYKPEEAEKYGNVILSAYQKLDRYLQELLATIDENTMLILMSDHGCGRKHPGNNQINQWLEAQGYLKYLKKPKQEGQGMISLLAKTNRLILKKTPRKIKEVLWRWFPQVRDQVQSRLCFAGIDWAKTKAFSDTLFPVIHINVKGRERLGIVDPEQEYRQLVDELKEKLYQMRDIETNDPIVDKVFHRDDIYSGPYVNKAPDILVRWREDRLISGVKLQDEGKEENVISTPLIPGEDYRVISGDHTLYGILLAWGKEIERRPDIQGARLIDLAPTILYAMSLPVPADMDGREILPLFKDEFIEKNPRQRKQATDEKSEDNNGDGYSEEEEEQMRERLRGLGYVE